jgi:hypothetical protein
MENNYKKLLCALSVITIVVIIIQLNIVFGSNLERNNNFISEDNTNLDNNSDVDAENLTSSINLNNTDRVTEGSNIHYVKENP